MPLKQTLVIAAAGTQRVTLGETLLEEPPAIYDWHHFSWLLVNELTETQTPEQPAAAQSDGDT